VSYLALAEGICSCLFAGSGVIWLVFVFVGVVLGLALSIYSSLTMVFTLVCWSFKTLERRIHIYLL
jgi:hypothetical protein